jgi:serine/threonine protein phosphatase PrpC
MTREYFSRCQAGTSDQDRAAVWVAGDAHVLVVADGAGTAAGGAQAADAVIAAAQAAVGAGTVDDWGQVLLDLDRGGLGGGESTAIIATVRGDHVAGASVGDSQAWILGERRVELTRAQNRKPLLGSGSAEPIAFDGAVSDAMLVLGSDGLFGYVPIEVLVDVARGRDLADAVECWVDLIRLPSGQLPDDVAVIVSQ